jgi:hypothetical protein
MDKQEIKKHTIALTRARKELDYKALGKTAVELFRLHDSGELELSKEDVKNLSRLLPSGGWHVHQLLNQGGLSVRCSFKNAYSYEVSQADTIRVMKAVYFANLKNELYYSVVKIIDTLQDKI